MVLWPARIGPAGMGNPHQWPEEARGIIFQPRAEEKAAMRIYVGNMPFSMSENDLRQLFEEFGEVSSVNIITDRDTGRPRGFGFVDIDDEAAGREAIEKADGREVEGRRLKVNEARPKRERGGGGRGGGGGGRW